MSSDTPSLKNLADLRQDYKKHALRRSDLLADPLQQFSQWFTDAETCKEILEPNAMTLSTANSEGLVTARIVLLKGTDERGFHFFTNYKSEKCLQIASNPHVALSFFWPALERQILIYGHAAKLPDAENKNYFDSRPRGSQLGAWASEQSCILENRSVLENRLAEFTQTYEGKEVAHPPHWGGYYVTPNQVEFWQGRSDRLHDRFRYTREKDLTNWKIDRLSP
ncbi:MAG: pyridoxamine 5'-phosphate oxidase [Chthoniobacterales bacterium]